MSHWQDGLVARSKSNWEDGISQPSPQSNTPAPPATLQGPPGPSTIGPDTTSVMDRVKGLFSHIPAVNPLVKPEQESLIAPQELMTPAEQGRHPVLTATGEVAGSLTSPQNAAILAGTAGLGELPGAAGAILPRLVSLGFSADMLHGAYKESQSFRDAMDRGDANGALYHLTHGILSTVMAGLAGAHATGIGKATTEVLPGETDAKKGDPLTPAEQSYVNTVIQANVQHGMETKNESHVNDTVEAAKEHLATPIATTITEGGVTTAPPDMAKNIFAMEAQLRDAGTDISQFRHKAMDLKEQAGDNTPWDDFYSRLLRLKTSTNLEVTDGGNVGTSGGLIRQVSDNAAPLEGGTAGVGPGAGAEGTRPLDASLSGEEAIRDGQRAAGGATDITGHPQSDTVTEAGGGTSPSIDGLSGPYFASPLAKLFADAQVPYDASKEPLNDRALENTMAPGTTRMHVADVHAVSPDVDYSKGGALEFRMIGHDPNDLLKDVPEGSDKGLAYAKQMFPEYADNITGMDIIKSGLRPGYRLRIHFDDPTIMREAAAKIQGMTTSALPSGPPDLAKLWGSNESDPSVESNRRIMLQGPAETATLGAVSQLHETLTGQPINMASEAGERGNGSVETREPAISKPVDTDLANGGITVIKPGKDLGLIARYLGSLSQSAARLGNPLFKSIADKITDVTIALARNTRDEINDFRSQTRAIVNPAEWDKVVTLLNNPDITPDNLDPALPDNIKTAYLTERARNDQYRLNAIASKRRALMASGMTADAAQKAVPDDYGIQQGYYHHAFPGNWLIMQKTPDGDLEAIQTGWRQLTLDAAHDKAKEYLAANPDAQLVVRLDQATLPGKSISDRNKLNKLMDDVRTASTLIYNGDNPEGVISALQDKAAAATYGPRRVAQRQNEALLQRDSNLPGWARDMDNYERYIQGMQRYFELAPARQELMAMRNQIASMSGMPEIQRIGDMPRRYSGDYANMLGRVDGSIEALEGYPTGLDAAIRNTLQHWGYDPNMVNRAYSFINSAEALLKLGFNPASAGLHLAQTVAATYPVLGEKWTTMGILKSYSSDYNWLVHDLGIEATSNLLDIDTFNAYKGGYFNEPGLGGKLAGGYKVLQQSGLFMFSKGIETARRVAAIGAYEKAISEGMGTQEARDYARDTLVRTQFMYSPADAPAVLRALPRPLTQFRTFTMKMMEYVTGLQGAEIPRFLMAVGAIGALGLPALTAVSSAIEKFTGYNPEDEMKKHYPVASRGVLGMLGIDYTKNIGFSDWLGAKAFDTDHLVGPFGSDMLNLGKAALASVQGPSRQGSQDIATALRNISPEARRLWDESQRLASGDASLTDPRSGSVIVKNLTPGERVELAAGLTPIRVAEERDAHDRIMKEIASAKDKRGYFVDKMADMQLEMMRGDLNEKQRMDLVAQTVQLGKMADDNGVGKGLPQAVRARAREMFSERLPRDVKHAPKSVRPQAWQELQGYQDEQQPTQ